MSFIPIRELSYNPLEHSESDKSSEKCVQLFVRITTIIRSLRYLLIVNCGNRFWSYKLINVIKDN